MPTAVKPAVSAGVLADHHQMAAIVLRAEAFSGREPDAHGDLGRHRKAVCGPTDSICAEIGAGHGAGLLEASRFVTC
jgi:hypothetical protein